MSDSRPLRWSTMNGQIRTTNREKNKSVQEPKEDKCEVHLEIVNLQEHTKDSLDISTSISGNGKKTESRKERKI